MLLYNRATNINFGVCSGEPIMLSSRGSVSEEIPYKAKKEGLHLGAEMKLVHAGLSFNMCQKLNAS